MVVVERIAGRRAGRNASCAWLQDSFPVPNDTLITGDIPLLLTKLSMVAETPPLGRDATVPASGRRLAR